MREARAERDWFPRNCLAARLRWMARNWDARSDLTQRSADSISSSLISLAHFRCVLFEFRISQGALACHAPIKTCRRQLFRLALQDTVHSKITGPRDLDAIKSWKKNLNFIRISRFTRGNGAVTRRRRRDGRHLIAYGARNRLVYYYFFITLFFMLPF